MKPEYKYPNHSQMKQNRLIKLKQTKGKCDICGERANSIHHIDGSKDNHSLDNLVVVCNSCHGVIHAGRINTVHETLYTKLYGKSVLELARQFNVNPPQIRYWRKKGVLQKAVKTGLRPKSNSFYRDKYGMSLVELSKYLHCSNAKISSLHYSGKLKQCLAGQMYYI